MLRQAFHKAASVAGSLYDDFKEFLSPSGCLCCGRDRDFSDPLLCPGCDHALRTKNIGQGPVCPFCGRPDGASGSCDFCRHPDHLRLYYWGAYDDELKECILRFKFHWARDLGVRLAGLATDSLVERLAPLELDVVVPVPLHKTRAREREYNQSEVISSEIARRMGIEHRSNLLMRRKFTRQQARLEETERWTNVMDAFAVNNELPEKIQGQRILLVDDIVTTGATIYEASKPLVEAGARRVDIFSLAYAI